jgi:hypothetical protein
VGSRGALRPRADDGELDGRACGRGEIGIVAGALEAAGYFCAQVRSNAASRQIWCRTVPEGGSADDSTVTRVDLVSTLNGQLQYAYFGLPLPTDVRWVDDRERQLMAVLNASILTLWPADSEQVRDVAAKVANPALGLGIKDRSDPRPPANETTTTGRGTYIVGEGRYFSEGVTVTGSPVLTLTSTTKVNKEPQLAFRRRTLRNHHHRGSRRVGSRRIQLLRPGAVSMHPAGGQPAGQLHHPGQNGSNPDREHRNGRGNSPGPDLSDSRCQDGRGETTYPRSIDGRILHRHPERNSRSARRA